MNAFGAALREAREKKGVTLSEAAAATRIKVQIIEDLENGVLRRAYAPIYIKGFIRIYGNYLGLEYEALLALYQDQQHETGTNGRKEQPARPPPPPRGDFLRKSAFFAGLRRAGAACAALPRQTILKTSRLPWSEWRGRITQSVKTAIAAIAGKIAGTQPPAKKPFLIRRLRANVRGPHRVPATVIAAIILMLAIIMSGILTMRRNAKDTDIEVEMPDPGAVIEFTHEPPPPYY